ncbi:Uncharacterised protein [Legionella steigerwaltii]|uniref:Uncharacterized protein n=1 Tax=Legionella steigerwaltii TaxID=460 RepID=A0A378L3Q3_9GAMM|nr:hypothetical protein [Legionella steigerwaltii]KTD77418.1 hypothetical protein Lstg_1775 [Legionella steigerwaltii]STY21715.1 Uncharacterised protein [Legionella steigerwaltii]
MPFEQTLAKVTQHIKRKEPEQAVLVIRDELGKGDLAEGLKNISNKDPKQAKRLTKELWKELVAQYIVDDQSHKAVRLIQDTLGNGDLAQGLKYISAKEPQRAGELIEELRAELAFQFIGDNPTEAIKLIQTLDADDLENGKLGLFKKEQLFEKAIRANQLDVANAIIERYAQVVETSKMQNSQTGKYLKERLKPLPIDYPHTDTYAYDMNMVRCIKLDTLPFYKDLIDKQKGVYLKSIQEEIKEFRIMGVEELLKVTHGPVKQKLSKALKSYKENLFADALLNQEIDNAFASLAKDRKAKESISYQQAWASLKTAAQLDAACLQLQQASCSLTSFKTDVGNILSNPSNNILKENRSFADKMASIGNFVARYTGIGYVVAATQGKFRDFHDFKWTLFNEKTKFETQHENIGSQITPKAGG